jgi:hypothetical protein
MFLEFFLIPIAYGFAVNYGYKYTLKKVLYKPQRLSKFMSYENKSLNRFAKEFDDLLINLIDIPDFCAAKIYGLNYNPEWVKHGLKRLKMFISYRIGKPVHFIFIRYFLKFFMLYCGQTMTALTLCSFEIMVSPMFGYYISQNIIPNVFNDTLLVYFSDEFQRSCISVIDLKLESNFIYRIIISPIISLVWIFLFYIVIFTRLIYNPKDFLDKNMYIELVKYLIVVTISLFHGIGYLLVYYTTPGNHQGETFEERENRISLMNLKTMHLKFKSKKGMEYSILM